MLFLRFTQLEAPTPDIFYLILQVLVSAGELEEAWNFARKEGEGSVARAWWRMEAVKVIAERARGEAWVSASWKMEWEWADRMMKDQIMWVVRARLD